MVSISLRGTQADECHDALQALSHNSVLKLLGLRLPPERLRKGPMAEAVEEAYLATPWTDSRGSLSFDIFALSNRHTPGYVELTAALTDALQPSHTRLKNPHNVCYLNSCAQALHWIGRLTDLPDDCFGAAKAALRMLGKAGHVYLPACLPWTPLLRGWRQLSAQHDAAEFMGHLLKSAAPSASIGHWQSRLIEPLQVVDAGCLTTPIPFDMRGANLQALIDNWTAQATVHALVAHSGVVWLQLKRYEHREGRAYKNMQRLPIMPGELVALPIFESAAGVNLGYQQFRVGCLVVHYGAHLSTGHYQTVYCVPNADPAAAWEFPAGK